MSARTQAFNAIILALVLLLASAFMAALPSFNAFGSTAKEDSATYDHSTSVSQNGVTFNVQWNDSADKTTTFHVTATGGSGDYKARMDVPTYWDNGTQESVCDPSRGSWLKYASFADGDTGTDFQFEFTASGTYRINFYFMDKANNVTYLRTTATVTIDDSNRPSITQIVNKAVVQAKSDTNGSDYDMVLWLHDWAIDQLKYDSSLNYCSAESGLTRGLGTCESYQRIYAKLLNAAGIANSRIEGNGHTWNAVKISGEWYQMDLTWDDSDNSKYYGFDARHLYFGLTDELMAIAHPDHKQTYAEDGYATRSTSLKDNYFVLHGDAGEWAQDYAGQIQAKLDAKEESFAINAKSANPQTGVPLPTNIANIQNGLIAYALNNMTWKSNGQDATLVVTYDDPANGGKGAFEFKATYKKEEASTPSSIAKTQNLAVKTKTKTVKKSKLKKKAQTVSGCIKASGAKGKLSYSKVSGSSKLSINKANGKVTVKKKTKKGTYKIRVKVAASSTKDYKVAVKAVTITIKVK